MVVFVFVIPFKICFQQLYYLVIKSITVIMYEYADGLKAELVSSFATLGFLDKIQLCKRKPHLESLYMWLAKVPSCNITRRPMTWLYSSLHAKWKYEMKCTIGKKIWKVVFNMFVYSNALHGKENTRKWKFHQMARCGASGHKQAQGCEWVWGRCFSIPTTCEYKKF